VLVVQVHSKKGKPSASARHGAFENPANALFKLMTQAARCADKSFGLGCEPRARAPYTLYRDRVTSGASRAAPCTAACQRSLNGYRPNTDHRTDRVACRVGGALSFDWAADVACRVGGALSFDWAADVACRVGGALSFDWAADSVAAHARWHSRRTDPRHPPR
jgi:hypothetical protein